MNTVIPAADRTSPTSTAAARTRSFFDLRRFAADAHAGVPVTAAAGADPFESCRRELHPEMGPVAGLVRLGAIDLPAGEGRVTAQPADEFIVVADGALRLTLAGTVLELLEGESAVVRAGSTFQWHCARATTVVYLRCGGDRDGADAKAAGGVVPIDTQAALEPSAAPAAELLLSPTPQCRSHADFRSSSGAFTCGTWDSTAYQRRAMVYAHWELMVLLEGSVTLEDETAQRRTFTTDDIFVVERGARCSWDSREPVKKVYAIYRPA